MASLSRAAELMYQTRKELVLLGDFNQDMYTNPVENRFPNKNLDDFCNRYCFENKITIPTRVTDRTKSLLDVILASHSERFICSGNLHLGLSDHDLVFIVRKHKIPRPNPRLVEYRSMKNFDHEKFLADLKNSPWGMAYCFSVVDDIWSHWSTLYNNILDQHAPIKKKWMRGDQLPWISPEILQEIGRRNRLFKRYRTNPANDLWVAYKQERNRVTSLKRKGIKEFCNNAISNAKHAGEFWKKMKPLLPNSSQSKLNGIILVEDGKILTEPSEVVEVFNNYFASVAVSETCSGSAEHFYDHRSVLGSASRQVLEHPFNFEPVSSSYLKEILDNLNPRKAVGADGISPRLLRLSAPVMAEEITRLINILITSCSWPDEWKCGNLTPVFKKDEDTRKENYRPVSVLTALSKVYEKVMYDQLYNTFCRHLSQNLSGFLKNHSCCTALLKMTEDWRRSLDKRESALAIAIDLSKAFDSIHHNLLLAKLKAYGLSSSALRLMSSYLLDRKQRVCLQGVCSSYAELKAGLPQGSLLGPLLFNIFINDLNYAVPDMSLRLYADDTTLYGSDVSPIVLQFTANQGLSQLSEWFDLNHLLINNAKTQALPIGPCKYDYDLILNGSSINKLPSIRILGMELDSMLNFKVHISDQLKKAYSKTGALRRIRRFLPVDTMLLLYKSFILPHLEYCSPLLLGVGKVQSQKIEEANHYIPRTLTGHGKSLPYQELLNIFKMDTLH